MPPPMIATSTTDGSQFSVACQANSSVSPGWICGSPLMTGSVTEACMLAK